MQMHICSVMLGLNCGYASAGKAQSKTKAEPPRDAESPSNASRQAKGHQHRAEGQQGRAGTRAQAQQARAGTSAPSTQGATRTIRLGSRLMTSSREEEEVEPDAASTEDQATGQAAIGGNAETEAAQQSEAGASETATGTAVGDEEEVASSRRGEGEEEGFDVFVVVGTANAREGSSWSPCKGRLLLIQVTEGNSGMGGKDSCQTNSISIA